MILVSANVTDANETKNRNDDHDLRNSIRISKRQRNRDDQREHQKISVATIRRAIRRIRRTITLGGGLLVAIVINASKINTPSTWRGFLGKN